VVTGGQPEDGEEEGARAHAPASSRIAGAITSSLPGARDRLLRSTSALHLTPLCARVLASAAAR